MNNTGKRKSGRGLFVTTGFGCWLVLLGSSVGFYPARVPALVGAVRYCPLSDESSSCLLGGG